MLWSSVFLCVLAQSVLSDGSCTGASVNPAFLHQPQVTTGPRLLHLGETFQLHLYLPDGYEGGDVYIFPRYLETAEPGDAFQAGGDLSWVEGQDRVRLQPDWRQQEGLRQAAVVFTGVATGN